MRNFAIRAVTGGGFRLTLDLSAWGALGVQLGAAVLRMQVFAPADSEGDPATLALEFATATANPATFDAMTGIAVFAAPATATAGLSGVFPVAARAEFANFALPLFGGSMTFFAGVAGPAPTSGLPTSDTAWISAQPFGPTPVPASLASAVASAQAAAAAALVRSMVFG